jgi:exopolyphosphatase/guanosine-5'-triphosphate,3'-diphosphate pyrophosphatase
MARTLEALKVCAQKIGQRKVAFGRYVATEAYRRAVNCTDFLAGTARDRHRIEIISTAEERGSSSPAARPAAPRIL